MPSALSREKLTQLAKFGAGVRLAEIKQEEAALNAILNGSTNRERPKQMTSAEPVRKRRRRATWTAAQRRAVSARMKKYWAKRRQAAKTGR